MTHHTLIPYRFMHRDARVSAQCIVCVSTLHIYMDIAILAHFTKTCLKLASTMRQPLCSGTWTIFTATQRKQQQRQHHQFRIITRSLIGWKTKATTSKPKIWRRERAREREAGAVRSVQVTSGVFHCLLIIRSIVSPFLPLSHFRVNSPPRKCVTAKYAKHPTNFHGIEKTTENPHFKPNLVWSHGAY